MKEIKNEFQRKIEFRIKRFCGKPSPKKRLIAVSVIIVLIAIVNIWFLVSSIYNIGKNDAEKELIKLQHIEKLEIRN